jgi:hypothetical protein
MSFGTVRCEKRDLAPTVAAAFGHLVRGPGDRVGAVLLTAAGMRRVPRDPVLPAPCQCCVRLRVPLGRTPPHLRSNRP